MPQLNGATGDPLQTPATTESNATPAISEREQQRVFVTNFLTLLNREPNPAGVDATPDGKARTLVISHVETELDEMFLGLWSTENFKWSVVSNEVVGSIELVVIHPVTGTPLRRTGAACVQIMVDAVPADIKANPILRNQWALNPDNKKAAALDKTFPALKAECFKNAALSFGKSFGRDLNRKNAAQFTGKATRKTKGAAAMDATKQLLNSQPNGNG